MARKPRLTTPKLPKHIERELRAIFSHPDGPKGRLRELERLKGSTWEFPLPTDDWEDGLVMIRGIEARIVLLNARAPGTGAFKRLLATINKAGFVAVVIEPTGPTMPKILRRWGWKCLRCGSGFDSWEEWRP